MGLVGWLTVLFVALKLTNVIDWPWMWVLSPIWFGICVLIGFFALTFAAVRSLR